MGDKDQYRDIIWGFGGVRISTKIDFMPNMYTERSEELYT